MVWSVDAVRIVQAITAKLGHVGMWSVDPTPRVVRWPVLDTYTQLLNYKDALENPPLLIVSDVQTIIIRSNFTNSVQRRRVFTVEGMLDPAERDALRNVWTNPEAFRSKRTTEAVTLDAATQFAKLADHLRAKGVEPDAAAHYLIRLLFCLFAEDIGLLPEKLFSKLVPAAH